MSATERFFRGYRVKRLCVFTLFPLVAAIVSAASASAQGLWQKAAPFPAPSEEVLGAAANGKMYVFAGLGPQATPKGLVYEYDPQTDAWTARKPMPLPSHHVAFTEYNGKIYAFGGFKLPDSGPRAWEPINNSWEYDPAADTWKALAPLPKKRGSACAVAVNGKIYVIGGAAVQPGAVEGPILAGPNGTPHRAVDWVDEYDPASNTWRARTSMPTARNHFGAAAVDGKIYAIGGRLAAAYVALGTSIDTVEVYDPATDSWGVPRMRMPTARASITSNVYKGRIYVAAGEMQDSRANVVFRAMEVYEPATNQWFTLPPMPLGRHGLAAAILGDSLHLVSGDAAIAGVGITAPTPQHDVLRLDTLTFY